MILLKSLLTEDQNVSSISPRDIYNFYFLATAVSQSPNLLHTPYGEYIADYYLGNLKTKYVSTYTPLLVKQLQKYASQKNRVEKGFDIKKVHLDASLDDLAAQMKLTKRSDRAISAGAERENKAWVFISDHLAKLSHATAPKDILSNIDRINNATHNTGTLILGKFINGGELLAALNACANVTNLSYITNKVDSDVKDILNQENEPLTELLTRTFNRPLIKILQD